MLDAYLTDTITWVQKASQDKWGTPTAGASQDIRCRHEIGSDLTFAYQGEQVHAAGCVWMLEQPSHEDNFVIDGVSHPIINIQKLRQGTITVGWRAWYK